MILRIIREEMSKAGQHCQAAQKAPAGHARGKFVELPVGGYRIALQLRPGKGRVFTIFSTADFLRRCCGKKKKRATCLKVLKREVEVMEKRRLKGENHCAWAFYIITG